MYVCMYVSMYGSMYGQNSPGPYLVRIDADFANQTFMFFIKIFEIYKIY